MNSWNVGNLEGLIPLVGGIYGYLLANSTLPCKLKDLEKMTRPDD